ncbi:MAG TPA: serine/threonine-protein kinase, partial [Vicinamibacterales bacterium]|nr:serine/threonine-protein kinase [Vicinamibacterales bacterium]
MADVTARLPATDLSDDTTSDTRPNDPATNQERAGDSGPLKPGQTFGPRYHIIRLLGMGGMGAVYHAWDTELGVSVAIKVIRPEIMADPSASADVERRFKRELVLARQVTHKNVVRIHDLGEIDRIKYITMSYVNGIDLATRLKNDGQLPVSTVMSLARAIVSGLVAAHAAGVVHRDLKPANVMLGVAGETLIMDFGIALSTGGPTEAPVMPDSVPGPLMLDTGVTMRVTAAATLGNATTIGGPRHGTAAATARTVVGTMQYMAPEQASGHVVDQRADIYAFGLILYDALAGVRRRSLPAGPLAELRARMTAAPASVRTFVPDVPDALDRLIGRCLEPNPDKRFQTTSELEAELARLDDKGQLIPVKRVFGTWTLATVIVLAVAALGGGWWYARSLIPPPPHESVQVMIADFNNLTGDSTFDRTVEPVLRRSLQTSSFINAYDHNAIMATVGGKLPETLDETAAAEIAAKQGFGVVLSGSIGQQGGIYTVSMRAVQTVTGAVVLNTTARASSSSDVLRVATNLVADVRKALGDENTQSAQIFKNTNLSTKSLEVVRLYAASQQAASNGRLDDARQYALKAVELDPEFGIG